MILVANSKQIECNEGDLLIEVLLNNGIHVPHFCYQEDLGCDGNCRMCMVEVKGAKRPQIACDTFVKEGMEVSTISDGITGVKRNILELELINHPVDCAICDQAGECKLQDYYMEYGLYDSKLTTSKNKKAKAVDLGSNVILDQERCVLCTRCVRFTDNITKTGELGVIGRGDHSRIGTPPNQKLDNDYAMNVVELCPVGALTSKDFRFAQRVWFLESVESICHGCSRGCNITIDYNNTKYSNEKVHRFRSRRNNDINRGFLCDYGRLSYKELNDSLDFEESKPEEFKELLENSVNKVALVSPSLTNEQLESVVDFCKTKDIKLFSKQYYDNTFGDEWLKTNDKSANFYTVKRLGINIDEDEFDKAIDEAELLINFDHDYLKTRELDKKLVHFTSTTCTNNYELVYKIRNFAHEDGTVVNCDGMHQSIKSTKYLDGTNSLTDILGVLR